MIMVSYLMRIQHRSYAMVQILHNDSVIHPWQSCSIVLHTIHNISYSAEGRYVCRVQDASNHICDRPLGNLSVISKYLSSFNPPVINNEQLRINTLI